MFHSTQEARMGAPRPEPTTIGSWRKRLRHGIPLAVAGAVALGGCAAGGGEGGTGELADGGAFTMAVLTDLGSLNPYIERQNFGFGLSTLVYDSLVNISIDGEVTSGLAEEWEASTTGATFTLRDDVTCSSGEPLTASHVAEVINWNSDAANGSSQWGLRTSTLPTTAVGDDDAGTVSVTLDGEDGTFLYRIGILPIVCSEGFADLSSLAAASDGTGPYVMASASTESYTFVQRDGYAWGPSGSTNDAAGMPDTVVIRVIPDETTQANLLLSGELNLGRVTGDDRDRLDAAGLESYDQALPGSWLAFNHQESRKTSDPLVREALVAAVDIEQIVTTSTGGRGEEPTSLLALAPWTCAGQTPVSELVPEYDPAAAAGILEDAGWALGTDGVRERDGERLTLQVNYSETEHALNRVTAELFASFWQAVGFETSLEASEGAASYEKLYVTSDFDVTISGWSFNLPSTLMPYLSGAMPPNGTNSAHLSNDRYEAKTAEALGMTVPEACPTWQEAEDAIIGDLDIVPMSNRYAGWYFAGAEGDVLAYNQIAPSTIRLVE